MAAKKLNLALIKENIKKYDEKVKVALGEDVYTHIYPNFSPTKISEMMVELLTDKERAEKAGIDFESLSMLDWFYLNIIKHFADVSIPTDIKKKVQYFIFLKESDYLPLIIQEFPLHSIERVTRAIENAKILLGEQSKIDTKLIVEAVEKELTDIEQD
jgi:hypothetical protein